MMYGKRFELISSKFLSHFDYLVRHEHINLMKENLIRSCFYLSHETCRIHFRMKHVAPLFY